MNNFKVPPISLVEQHPQHIVAFPAHLVDDRVDGWSDYKPLSTDLIFACRGHLESNTNYRQLMPVFILVQNRKIWCYVRGKASGEAKLHGKIAAAVGGHWDLADIVINPDSTIDYEKSIRIAGDREVREEIGLSDSDILKITTLPRLYASDANPVDRLHACVVTVYELQPDVIVEAKEAALEPIGFMDIHDLRELIAKTDQVVEDWTRMAYNVCRELKLID